MKSCEYCGSEHDEQYGSDRFCSLKCARGFSSKEKRELIKSKISDKLKGSGHPPVTLTCKNCGNSFIRPWSKRFANFCSRSCKQIYTNTHCEFTEDRKMKLSKSVKNLYTSGKLVYGGKTKWFIYNGIKVQGTYELRACKILDDWKEHGKIASWEYTKDRIKYFDDHGKIHNYLLDFKVFRNDGSFYYIETKGYVKNVDILKWAEVSKQYELQVWRESDLRKYENIKQ